jgi:hypothetical protein
VYLSDVYYQENTTHHIEGTGREDPGEKKIWSQLIHVLDFVTLGQGFHEMSGLHVVLSP